MADAQMGEDRERAEARQLRIVALVIAATTVIWLAVQWIGGAIGLTPRYAFLADFAALAAFIWAIVVAARIWRLRRKE